MPGAAIVADVEAGSVAGKLTVFGVPVEVGEMTEKDGRSVQAPRETVLGGPYRISVAGVSLRILAQWAGEGMSRSALELLRYAGSTAERAVAAAPHARRKTRILV